MGVRWTAILVCAARVAALYFHGLLGRSETQALVRDRWRPSPVRLGSDVVFRDNARAGQYVRAIIECERNADIVGLVQCTEADELFVYLVCPRATSHVIQAHVSPADVRPPDVMSAVHEAIRWYSTTFGHALECRDPFLLAWMHD